MAPTEEPVKEGEGGTYGALARRPLPEGLVLLFMPSLAALLEQAEELKRSPLAEEQAIRIRDAAVVVATPSEVAAAVREQRGYPEVDPADAWSSWQTLCDE